MTAVRPSRPLNQILSYLQSYLASNPSPGPTSTRDPFPFGSPIPAPMPSPPREDPVPPPELPRYDGNASHDLIVKRLTKTAVLPTRGSKFAAGYDLAASEPATVPAHGRLLISTGLSIAVPTGTYGRVAPRSGLAVKKGIDVGAGVIDEDYRGEVKVLLFNFSDDVFFVKAGDRIAQLILEKIETPEVVEIDELDASERGEAGFGSSGISS